MNYAREAGSVPDGMPANRSYNSIDDAVDDCLDSRVFNGYHFRTGIDVGAEMARERARYILVNHLTRKPDVEYPDLEEF